MRKSLRLKKEVPEKSSPSGALTLTLRGVKIWLIK